MTRRSTLLSFVIVLGCGGAAADAGTSESGESSGSEGESGESGEAETGDGDTGDGDTGDGDTGDGDGDASCDGLGPWPDESTVWPASRDLMGAPLNSGGFPSLSGDGRFVAYVANVDPLGGPARDFLFDAYIYDARCDTTMRVPFDPPPEPVTEVIWPALSGDGTVVAFHTRDSNFASLVYAYDLIADTIEPISVGQGGPATTGLSERPVVSHDGRYVAFQSSEALHPDDTNDQSDVYLRDRELGVTELISRANDGTVGELASQFPSISGDGRFVAFESLASNLSDEDGSGFDIFVRDRELEITELVSPDPDTLTLGHSNQPSISGDGRFVAYQSDSEDLIPEPPTAIVEIFVYDRELDTVERVSVDERGVGVSLASWRPKISGDGRRVLFTIGAVSMDGSEAQAWVRDRQAGTLTQVSVNAEGTAAARDVVNLALSADGQWAAFETQASNLTIPPETMSGWDAFVVGVD